MAFQLVNDSTLSAIVQNVAALVSYPVPSDPAGDTDPAVQQMVQAVNLAGLDLLAMHDWQELTKSHSISIVADTAGQREPAFALPEDFYEFVDPTQWHISMQWPAIGPVRARQWQALLIRQTLPTLSFYWLVRGTAGLHSLAAGRRADPNVLLPERGVGDRWRRPDGLQEPRHQEQRHHPAR